MFLKLVSHIFHTKAASLLVAADAAARNGALNAKGPQRFGCCIVGVFEVGPGYVEPAAKKAKKEGSDKVPENLGLEICNNSWDSTGTGIALSALSKEQEI